MQQPLPGSSGWRPGRRARTVSHPRACGRSIGVANEIPAWRKISVITQTVFAASIDARILCGGPVPDHPSRGYLWPVIDTGSK